MSDHADPKNEDPQNVDDVVGSANEGLDAAAAARDDVQAPEAAQSDVDADMEAFAAAERDYPGTFGTSDAPRGDDSAADAPADAADAPVADAPADDAKADAAETTATDADAKDTWASDTKDTWSADADAETSASAAPAYAAAAAYDTDRDERHTSVADTAYGTDASQAETQVVPAEPTAPPAAPQPIFVQAPEPPRELGNRGAAGAIGLVAALCFAVLYLGATVGLKALAGEVSSDSIVADLLAPLTTWSFWVPVVVFFLSFWLLGAVINRARWGKWVVFGLFVAAATYGGHLLGQLFQAPFWRITASESTELIGGQLLAPLAIAAFLFARELTIWFGAWVARSGARKKALNAEAQAEYERTLEAGPSAMR